MLKLKSYTDLGTVLVGCFWWMLKYKSTLMIKIVKIWRKQHSPFYWTTQFISKKVFHWVKRDLCELTLIQQKYLVRAKSETESGTVCILAILQFRSWTQSLPWIYSEFEVSLGYRRFCLKKRNRQTNHKKVCMWVCSVLE